jgi:hypothetical protein
LTCPSQAPIIPLLGRRCGDARRPPRCDDTRTDFNTLRYEVTIDDPGACTASWTAGFMLRWEADAELFEYVCQENNRNPDMTMDDEGQPLARSNRQTP